MQQLQMNRYLLRGLFAVSASISGLCAQGGIEATITTIAGKQVPGKIVPALVDIELPYGKLSIPLDRILLIQHAPNRASVGGAESALQASDAVKQLVSQEKAVREGASQKLFELGASALPALREGAKSGDAGLSKACKGILADLRAQGIETDANSGGRDQIITSDDQRLFGKILNRIYEVESDLSGVSMVPIEKIARISFAPLSLQTVMEPSLLGSRNQSTDDKSDWRVSRTAGDQWTRLSFDDSQWKVPNQHHDQFFDPEGGDRGRLYFRRAFRLEAVPAVATLTINEATAYAVFINGNRIDGAGDGQHAIGAHLRPGANVVAIQLETGGGKAAIWLELGNSKK